MLAQGDKVPDLALTDDRGKTIHMKDFLGKTLVVWFYPKDDTPG